MYHRVRLFSLLLSCRLTDWWWLEPLPDPSKFAPREGENEKNAARRRNADVQAEYNAVTCVAIYMLVMQFSQEGIDELRKYQEHMEMRHPEGDFVLSDGFDEGALGSFQEDLVKAFLLMVVAAA